MSNLPQRRSFAEFVLQISLAGAFTSHLIVATCYWWLSPKGFPITHNRFWLNAVLPLVVMAVAAFGLVGLLRSRQWLAGFIALIFASAWLGSAFVGRSLFQSSLQGFWWLGVLIALCGFGYAWLLLQNQPQAAGRSFFCGILALLAGAFCIVAQVAPPASTQPLNLDAPESSLDSHEINNSTIKLGHDVHFNPSLVELELRRENVSIHCFPSLQFDRVSPDGFWSLLSPPRKAKPNLLSAALIGSSDYCFHYSNTATVQLSKENSDAPIQCTSWTQLERDTYSHLNSFCYLLIEGHEDFSI